MNSMVVVIMGVSGSGKSTVGRLLARELDSSFFDGDDYHPQANVAKMAAGVPLTDADRWPWLDRLRALIDARLERGTGAVIACSALKRAYRERLGVARPDVGLVYLRGDFDLIRRRMEQRSAHFMGAEMLASQFAALEEPGDAESALVVDVSAPPEALVAEILSKMPGTLESPGI